MSFDLYIFSPQVAAVTFQQIASVMARRGWDIRQYDDMAHRILPDEPLGNHTVIVGWDRTVSIAEDFRQLCEPGRQADLEQLPEEKQILLGGCEFSENTDSAAFFGEDEEEQAEWWAYVEQHGTPAHLACLRRAKRRYYLRTGASINPMRFIFQFDLAWAIASVTQGVIEDPQEGKCVFARDCYSTPRTPNQRMIRDMQLFHMYARGFPFKQIARALHWLDHRLKR